MLKIRWGEKADLQQVAAIDACCYGNRGIGLGMLTKFFDEDDAAILVAHFGRFMVGYCAYRVDLKRALIRLKSICTHPSYRRKKVASGILAKIKERLELIPGGELRCDVPETNLPAQLLLRKAGLKCTRINKDARGEEYHFSSITKTRNVTPF